MSLQDLIEVPQSEAQWLVYTFAARVEYARIRDAIQSQKGIELSDRVTDPFNPLFTKDYLQNVQQLHQDFNRVLGVQGQDLQDIDLNNKEQLSEYISNVYQEVYTAEQALGI